MATSPRILTVRVRPADDGTVVLVEFGNVELERKIPENVGVQRVSAIFDTQGKLADIEIITAKNE